MENGSHSSTTTFPRSNDPRIDGLLTPYKWAGTTISYSDPDSRGDYLANYPEYLTDFSRISTSQLRTAQAVFDATPLGQPAGGAGFSVEGFTNLTMNYAGGGSGRGTIRLANTSDPTTAYAYMPEDSVVGGDAFFGKSGRKPIPGNYDYATMIHEIGHTLGLKHGHETYYYDPLPGNVDSSEYTVMTYRSYIGSPGEYYTSEAWGGAQTFMMLDIAALQRMYGADFTTSGGDTTYTWSPTTGQARVNGVAALTPGGNRVFETVWDGGGNDTYDLSNYATNLRIDLTPGGSSTFSSTQLANLGGGPNNGDARGNVFNALQYRGDPRSLIENAIGGSGRDSLLGNAADNRLVGNGGDDTLTGLDGSDMLRGGAGRDALRGGNGADVLIGGAGGDTFLYAGPGSTPGERDILRAGDGAAAFEVAGAAAGDRFDFRAVDANAGVSGDQAFLIGAATTVGHIWLTNSGSSTIVSGNLDSDAGIEFQLAIEDGLVVASAYTTSDFLL